MSGDRFGVRGAHEIAPTTPPVAGCGAWWLRVRDEPDVTRVDRPSAGIGGGDVECALAIPQELVTVRAGPQVAAALEHHVVPGGVRLQSVMPPAQPRDVAGAGGPAGGVRDDVVAVGSPSRAGAPREDAGLASSR